MKPRLVIGAAIAAVILGAAAADSVVVVGQSQQALVLQLGAPVAVINAPGTDEPGLKFKIPLVQSVVRLDRREQELPPVHAALTTADGRPLTVEAQARYRIVRPLAYYAAVRAPGEGPSRLSAAIGAAVRQALASAPAAEIVAGAPGPAAAALADARTRTGRLGVELTSLDLANVAPDAAGAQAIDKEMNAGFAREAAEIRAEGQTRKTAVMARADSDAAIALAQANAKAFGIRGEGDAKAAAIYDASFGRDPGFAAFYRSLQAYEGVFDAGQTTLVLPADTAFFKYLRFGPKGR